MTEERSIELAAQAWCHWTTKDIVMNPALGSAFATILKREVEAAEKIAFQQGRDSVYRAVRE